MQIMEDGFDEYKYIQVFRVYAVYFLQRHDATGLIGKFLYRN